MTTTEPLDPDFIAFLLRVDFYTIKDGLENGHTDWRKIDGSPLTAPERELLGRATPADIRAAASILRADLDLDYPDGPPG